MSAFLVLAGCGNIQSEGHACGGNNFDTVTLRPGCSTICFSEPCKVNFVMPAGKGDLVLRDGNISLGAYPAGQTVFVGSLWLGSHVITVEGTDAEPAYLSVGGGRGMH
ncbi:MAG: hypothetical protein ABFS23_10410 [Pseudomonadota bacterium]